MRYWYLALALMTIPAVFCNSYADESIPVGTSRFKIEAPKSEPQVVTSARYVLDSRQELSASCPNNSKVISAACEADTRSFHNSFISDDLSMHTHFTKTSLVEGGLSTAKCTAVFVRPDEILKLSMTLKCQQNDSVVEARN